jgi:hypothetical protein
MIIFKVKYYLARVLLYLFILPKRGYGLELGVRWGGNAKLLYYLTFAKWLELVDDYNEHLIHSEEEIGKMIARVKSFCYNRPVRLFQEKSWDACRRFTENYFDWIYIDADHSDLYNDLTYWFDQVRPGGVIMGDDLCDAYPLIETALRSFCDEHNLKFKKFHVQWWIRK